MHAVQEALPSRYANCCKSDLPVADLVVVLGTSLQVAPVASLPFMVDKAVPRLLINLEPVRAGSEFRFMSTQSFEFDSVRASVLVALWRLITRACSWGCSPTTTGTCSARATPMTACSSCARVRSNIVPALMLCVQASLSMCSWACVCVRLPLIWLAVLGWDEELKMLAANGNAELKGDPLPHPDFVVTALVTDAADGGSAGSGGAHADAGVDGGDDVVGAAEGTAADDDAEEEEVELDEAALRALLAQLNDSNNDVDVSPPEQQSYDAPPQNYVADILAAGRAALATGRRGVGVDAGLDDAFTSMSHEHSASKAAIMSGSRSVLEDALDLFSSPVVITPTPSSTAATPGPSSVSAAVPASRPVPPPRVDDVTVSLGAMHFSDDEKGPDSDDGVDEDGTEEYKR